MRPSSTRAVRQCVRRRRGAKPVSGSSRRLHVDGQNVKRVLDLDADSRQYPALYTHWMNVPEGEQMKAVVYLRVSTQQQGRSGLGLEAQRQLVETYLSDGKHQVLGEYVEVETGKGADALARRPKLAEALTLCKKHGATLVIAKLDRLARNVAFVAGLMESGVDFVAADMPQANKVMIQMHAVMSEWERDQISARTKAALAAAKARGVQLGATGPANLKACLEERTAAADGYAEKLRGTLAGMQARGLTRRAMVEELNSIGVRTATGGVWHLTQLQRTMTRLAEVSA
jgi:DNA invertase Pin-like site-specific DNA recombinase